MAFHSNKTASTSTTSKPGTFSKEKNHNMKLPDGPQIPTILQLIKWIGTPFKYLEDCSKRYGDIFTLRLLGFPPLVVIGNPQGIEDIFSADAEAFDAGRTNEYFRPYFGENCLLLIDGERHKRKRKLIMPPFHGEKVKSYAESICQIAERITSQWQVNKPFLAMDAMKDMALETILQILFGLNEGDRYQEIKSLLIQGLDTIFSWQSGLFYFKFLQKDWGEWSPWGKYLRYYQKIHALLQDEIESRRANPQQQGNDFLSLMLSMSDEDGQPMTDEELRDEIIALLIAGHESTTVALSWAIYWVNKLPEVKERLVQEIDSLGKNPDPIAISRLPYLTAVCQEALRIYPVFPITFKRITNSTAEIMGRKFEPGTVMLPSIYLAHHREDIYPEPKKFLPERFLERKYSAFEFLPFGGGNRICPGYALVMLEMKLTLSTILSSYELELANDEPVKIQSRGVSVYPSNGVPMVVTGKKAEVQSQKASVCF